MALPWCLQRQPWEFLRQVQAENQRQFTGRLLASAVLVCSAASLVAYSNGLVCA